VLISGGSEGFKANILKEFSSFGVNKVWIFPRRPPEARDRFSWRQIRMTTKETDGLLGACPSLQRMTPVLEFTAGVQCGDRKRPAVKVAGIRPVWHEIEQRFVTAGRPFTPIDLEAVRNVCLVNDKAIEELGIAGGGPGSYVLVGGRRFLIVGVVETKSVNPMGGQDEARSEVYVPLNTAEVMKPDWGVYAIAQTRAPELFDDAKAEIRAYMRRVRHLKPEDPDTFGVEAIEQYLEVIRRVGTIMQYFLSGLVMVALLVGGVGIMVIQFVSVKERTREIGLRKAVGARPGVILAQFLVESVVLCVAGAGIGLAAGYAAVLGLRLGVESMKEAVVPLWAAVVAVGFCSMVGTVFGLIPAVAAARLDPIKALRHE
jgi:putative ABC transport system permease protein